MIAIKTRFHIKETGFYNKINTRFRVCKKNCVNALTMIYEAKYFASFLSFK